MNYSVEAIYKGGLNPDTDAVLRSAAGRPPDNGICFFIVGDEERDIYWYCDTMREAQQLADTIRNARIPGVKVVIYED
jgi:hypothetical protein